MRIYLGLAVAVLAVSACKNSAPAEQTAKRFSAANGTDVANQIDEYTAEFVRAFRAGDPLPEFVFSNGEVLSSGQVTNFREFASSSERADFIAQFPATSGNDVNEAKAQAFEAFLDELSSGTRAGGGFRGGPGIRPAGIRPLGGCGFPIYYKPCVQFGKPGICVNCFANPGGCFNSPFAWACNWTLDCNRCFPW